MIDDAFVYALAAQVAAGLAEGPEAETRARGALAAIGVMLAKEYPEDPRVQAVLEANGELDYEPVA